MLVTERSLLFSDKTLRLYSTLEISPWGLERKGWKSWFGKETDFKAKVREVVLATLSVSST